MTLIDKASLMEVSKPKHIYCIQYIDDDYHTNDKIIRAFDDIQSATDHLVVLFKKYIIQFLKSSDDGIDETLISIYTDTKNICDDQNQTLKQEDFDLYVNEVLQKIGFDHLHIDELRSIPSKNWIQYVEQNMEQVISNFIDNNIQIQDHKIYFGCGTYNIIKVEYISNNNR